MDHLIKKHGTFRPGPNSVGGGGGGGGAQTIQIVPSFS